VLDAHLDGKTFARQLAPSGPLAGKAAIHANFPDLPDGGRTRDAMVLSHGGKYYCYSVSHPDKKGGIYCSVSTDLRRWGAPKLVSAGGAPGEGPYSAECPFVHYHQPSKRFYFFRTRAYGKEAETFVYAAPTPLDFGVNDDRYLVTRLPLAAPEVIVHEGALYLAHLRNTLDGVQIARLALTPKTA
jgi:hypothetical protein